jgi:hypothetical protein
MTAPMMDDEKIAELVENKIAAEADSGWVMALIAMRHLTRIEDAVCELTHQLRIMTNALAAIDERLKRIG